MKNQYPFIACAMRLSSTEGNCRPLIYMCIYTRRVYVRRHMTCMNEKRPTVLYFSLINVFIRLDCQRIGICLVYIYIYIYIYINYAGGLVVQCSGSDTRSASGPTGLELSYHPPSGVRACNRQYRRCRDICR